MENHVESSESSKERSTPDDFKYWCFISYRHADNKEQDRKWASWLHRAIEQYDVPANLIGTKNSRGDIIPERIYPVFRDEESLPADAHLGERIREALDHSRILVVLCSPRSAESQYVRDEVDYFIEQGRRDMIIPAIIAGEPGSKENECFPKPLVQSLDEEGNLDVNSGPLAADFRLADGGEGFTSAEAYRLVLKTLPKREALKLADAYDSRLHLMKLKVIAGILCVPLESLRDRDKAYQLELARKRSRRLRIWVSLISVVATLAIIAGLLAVDQREEAVFERDNANKQRAVAELQAGKGHMLRARVAKSQSNDAASLMHAARAVGFSGLGNRHKARDPRINSNIVKKIRNKINSIHLHPSVESKNSTFNDYPNFFSGSLTSEASAFRWIDSTNVLPFLWSSPVHFQHTGSINSISWSPDGSLVVTASSDGYLKIWDAITGKHLTRISGGNVDNHFLRGKNCVSWHPEGDLIAFGSDGGTVTIRSPFDESTAISLKSFSRSVRTVDWSFDGQWLVAGGVEGFMTVWKTSEWGESFKLDGHSGPVLCAQWSPSRNTIASGSSDKTIKLWDWNGQTYSVRDLIGHTGAVRSLAWKQDSKLLLSGCVDNTVRLWDTEDGSLVGVPLNAHKEQINDVAWAGNDKFVTTSNDLTVGLWNLNDKKLLQRFNGHADYVNAICWHPSQNKLVSGSGDGILKVWDLNNLEDVPPPLSAGIVSSAAWKPDGEMFASSHWEGKIKIFESVSGRQIKEILAGTEKVLSIDWSRDGKLIAAGSEDGVMQIWNVDQLSKEYSFGGEKSSVSSVRWNPLQDCVGFISGDIKIFYPENGKFVRMPNSSGSGYFMLTWSPEGELLASAGNRTIKVWSIRGEEIGQIPLNRQGIESPLAWCPDGVHIAYANDSGVVQIWNIRKNEQPIEIHSHQRLPVNDLKWNSTGSVLATCGNDGTIRLFDGKSGSELAVFHGHAKGVNSIDWSFDDRIIISSSSDGTVKMWALNSGKQSVLFDNNGTEKNCVGWSPDSSLLATGDADGNCQLVDLDSGSVNRLNVHDSTVHCVEWSPNGELIASVSGKSVKVCDRSGNERYQFSDESTTLLSVAWKHDSKEIAISSRNNTVKIISFLNSEEKISSLPGYSMTTVHSVDWSPSGRQLVSGGDNGIVVIRDLSAREPLKKLVGHAGDVHSVCWGGYAGKIVSGGKDGTVRIWDAKSGNSEVVLRGHSGSIWCVDFSPDGSLVTSIGDDGILKLWNPDSGKEVISIKAHDGGGWWAKFSKCGKFIATAGVDGKVSIWAISELKRPDLFYYIQLGWCEFEEDSGNLRWSLPLGNLMRPVEMDIRNPPPHSFLSIAKSGELEKSEKVWQYYLLSLEAGNWKAAGLFYDQLNEVYRSQSHWVVLRSIHVLNQKAKTSASQGRPHLAKIEEMFASQFGKSIQPVKLEDN